MEGECSSCSLSGAGDCGTLSHHLHSKYREGQVSPYVDSCSMDSSLGILRHLGIEKGQSCSCMGPRSSSHCNMAHHSDLDLHQGGGHQRVIHTSTLQWN